MKKFIKWTMLVYNLLALSFLPLFLTAFLPETSILWDIAWHLNNWLFMVLVLLIAPFQNYFVPQIVALVLIGLYVNELRLDSYSHSIKAELPAAVGHCIWTAFSAVYMLLTYLAMSESAGVPLT